MLFINKRYILTILFSLLLCSLHPMIKTVVLTFYSLLALKSVNHSLKSFSIISYIFLLNPSLMGWTMPIHILIKIGFIFTIFTYTLLKFNKRVFNITMFRFLTYFSLSILVINIFHPNNSLKTISILKIALFYFTTSYLVIAFSVLKDLNKIITWIMSIIYISVFGSLFIYLFMYSYGLYLETDSVTLFRGMLLHPNAVGILLIPAFIILLPLILADIKKSRFTLVVLISIVFLIFQSGARGSLVGLTISSIFSLVLILFSKNRRKELSAIFKQSSGLIALFIIFFSAFYMISTDLFLSFLIKSSNIDDGNLSDIFLASRAKFITFSYLNFTENPYWGIGYGIPSILDFSMMTFDPIFGLPISAPSEKAFFFTAILEEFGLIGTFIFLIFYVKMSLYIFKNVSSSFYIFLFFSILGLSIFEFYIFSMGTLGSFNWIWIAFLCHPSVQHKSLRSAF